MNDIEELIKRLKECSTWHEDSKKLYDYITNLQEENKEEHDFDETMKDIKDNLIARIQRQEKEIEDLKEQVEYQDLWRKEYLSRIDKAIEYIKENSAFLENDEYEVFNKKELLDILQGSDKE